MPKRTKRAPDPDRTLDDILAELGVEDWDYVLIGDGSGSSWHIGMGWACVCVERVTGDRSVWYGSGNAGTSNLAELLAYLQPLTWIGNRNDDDHGKRIVRAVVISDSQYAVDYGQGKVGGKNSMLRSMFDAVRRSGVVVTWRHLGRNSISLNDFADRLSRAARTSVSDSNRLVDEAVEKIGRTSIYHINPDQE